MENIEDGTSRQLRTGSVDAKGYTQLVIIDNSKPSPGEPTRRRKMARHYNNTPYGG